MRLISKSNWPIFLLAIFNVALHLYFGRNLEYHRDELLYFSLGMHPAFGYATVPPVIGWIAWLMQNVFGNSVFAVRLFPALMGGTMVFLISAIAKELGGSGYARILAAIGVMVSIFGLRTFLLFMPVHVDLILWTLLFYLIIRYINTSSDKYLVLIGITAGAALLNKYLIVLLLLVLLIIIPFTSYRSIFRNKKFLYGLLAGLIIFLPNLIWQIVNGLPVIPHLGELQRTQLVNVSKTSFLINQLVSPGAASIFTIAGIIYLFINKEARKYRFLGLVVLVVIAILMFLKGKSYYTQGVFPFLIAAGAVSWEKILKTKLLRLFLVFLILIITWPILPIGVPIYKKDKLVNYFNYLKTKYGMDFICRFEDNSIHSLPQDYADMLGWKELAAVTARAWDMVPDKSSAFIYCENYGQAGAITIIGKKYNLPEAVCFNESFKYWIPRRFDPDIKTMIYINYKPGDDVRKVFRKISWVGSISDPDAREFGTAVYLCEDPVSSFNGFWTARISHVK